MKNGGVLTPKLMDCLEQNSTEGALFILSDGQNKQG